MRGRSLAQAEGVRPTSESTPGSTNQMSPSHETLGGPTEFSTIFASSAGNSLPAAASVPRILLNAGTNTHRMRLLVRV